MEVVQDVPDDGLLRRMVETYSTESGGAVKQQITAIDIGTVAS